MTLGIGAGSLKVVDPESDVVLLQWPDPKNALADLARLRVPRLLLVAPDGEPPTCTDCLEDWVRLPVDDADLHARLRALAAHHRVHARPTVDEFGLLRLGESIIILPPRERRLAEILIRDFGEVVRDDTIGEYVFGSDMGATAIRVHVSRLRKHIAPLDLTITAIRNVGYVMRRVDEPSAPSTLPAPPQVTEYQEP